MDRFKELFEEMDVDDVEDELESCDDLTVKMFDFIESNVDIDNLNDEQSDDFDDILIQMENFDDLEEGAKIRKKISPQDKKRRARDYRKNRATLKRKAKKFRKTSKFKKYQKKAKRLGARGKTSTGKRQTKFL